MNRLLTGPAPYAGAAVVMTAAALFESGYGGPEAGFTVHNVSVSLVVGASVLLARWAPFAGVLLLVASIGVPPLFQELPPTGGTQLIAAMLLVGNAAYRLGPRMGLLAYAVGALVPATTLVWAGETVWEFAFFVLVLGPAWVVGILLRREHERSAELHRLTEALRVERSKQAEVAVAAERTRISQELHDAVAHTVSVMTLQVGVVRRRLQDRPVEEEALRGAEELGRQAVDELRRIVGLVREGEPAALAPLPSLAQLDELVANVRTAGTTVAMTLTGPLEEVPQAVDMSAYRILQEALTNALRHAPGAPVEVAVEVDRQAIRLAVVNGRATRPAVAHPAGGHGLPGMRERAAVLGGTLAAEPRGDGFAVEAVLPLAAPRAVAAREGATA
ncbi:sensor histidine kinase [Nocardioides caldifontis]|uniref:sensor histidine kinase n=1 Tax=Nocardioides caldifontis TaxID=2588938 RepID=UPI0011DF028D|nr:histidine kinase [Nocardioides caldifontis]